MTPQTCRNCQSPMEGNYCPHCGQRAIGNQRLHFTAVLRDFLHNTFNLDKGFFFTLWQLFIRPGKVAQSFIDGQRKRFTNPTRYLIIAMAYQAFVDYWFKTTEVVEGDKYFYFSFFSEETNNLMAAWHVKLTIEYIILANLSLILIYPVLLYLFFKNQKFNYTELLTVSFYHISTFNLIGMTTVLTFKYLFDIEVTKEYMVTLFLGYILWSAMSFFKNISFPRRLLKILLVISLMILFRILILPLSLSYLFPLASG